MSDFFTSMMTLLGGAGNQPSGAKSSADPGTMLQKILLGSGPPGTSDQPWNPAAPLAMGGMQQPRQQGGLLSPQSTQPPMSQGIQPPPAQSFMGAMGNAVAPNTMASMAAKGGGA